jgi:hypothetical protein
MNEDDFDRYESRATGGFLVIFAVAIVLSMSLVGTLIWAIVRLAQHFVG